VPKRRRHHAPEPKRRRARGRTRSGGRGRDPELERLVDAVERTGAALDGVERGLEAEAWASRVAGTWYVGGPPGSGEVADRFLDALLRRLARLRTPRATAVAQALAAVLPPAPASRARGIADALVVAGCERPAWAATVGVVEPGGAWLVSDVHGDGESVIVRFREHDAAEHAMLGYIDENLGGMVKDLVLVDDAEAALAAFRAATDEGVRVEELRPADAAARLRAGLEVTDMTFDPPVSDSYREFRLLLDARLRALPADGEVPAVPEVPEEERAALVAEFLASAEAAPLAGVDDLEEIAWQLLDYRCDAADGRPLRWSPAAVEILLADWLPRKVVQDPGWFAQIPPALAAMVRFAGRRAGLEERFVAQTLEAVERYGPELVEAAADPEEWGPAKGLVMRMREEGVDLADEEAVQRWVDAYNASLGERGPPWAAGDDPFELDDEDADRWIAEWEEVDAHALEILRSALAGERGAEPPQPELALAAARLREGFAQRRWPHPHIRRGAGFRGRLPSDDAELVVRATASYMAPADEMGMDIEEEAAVASLDHADWLGAVLGLVRAGVGASAEPDDLARHIAACPEIEGPPGWDDDSGLELAFEIVLPAWQAAGAVDDDRRLTELGAWALPRALARAWGGDLDREG
jgi:hypothetical protein